MQSKEFYKIANEELNRALKDGNFKKLPGAGTRWQSIRPNGSRWIQFTVHFDWHGWGVYTGGRFICRFELFDKELDPWGNSIAALDYTPSLAAKKIDPKYLTHIFVQATNKMKPYEDDREMDELKGYLREYGYGSSWTPARLKSERWFVFYDEQDVRSWLGVIKSDLLASLSQFVAEHLA